MRSSDVTLLIPEMNFTCFASIIGFAVAGIAFSKAPYSQIQIWRKDNSQDTIYHKVNTISVNTNNNGSVCVAKRIIGNTYSIWCILFDAAHVQPGDILGLELMDHSNNEIFFAKGQPENYVFRQQLGINVSISNSDNNSYTITQQLPQIILNFTLGMIFNSRLSLSLSLPLSPSLPFSIPLSFRFTSLLCAFMINQNFVFSSVHK